MRIRNPEFAIRKGAGFTLLEILLTVFILALIMSLVYGVVSSTIEAQKRIEEKSLGAEAGPAILAQIRDDLEGAFLPDPKEEGFLGYSRTGSLGSRDRVDFITTTMSFAAKRDEEPRFNSVNKVGYQVLDNPEDPSLGILYRRLDPFIDKDPMKGGTLTELYDKVKNFKVTYYDGKNFLQDWSSKKQQGKLPQAIKIELTIVVSERGGASAAERSYSIIVSLPQ